MYISTHVGVGVVPVGIVMVMVPVALSYVPVTPAGAHKSCSLASTPAKTMVPALGVEPFTA